MAGLVSQIHHIKDGGYPSYEYGEKPVLTEAIQVDEVNEPRMVSHSLADRTTLEEEDETLTGFCWRFVQHRPCNTFIA